MGYRYTIPVQYKDALALFYHHPQVLLQSQIEPHNFAEFQQFPIFNFVTFCIHLLKMISVIPKKILLHFNNVHVDTTPVVCTHSQFDSNISQWFQSIYHVCAQPQEICSLSASTHLF